MMGQSEARELHRPRNSSFCGVNAWKQRMMQVIFSGMCRFLLNCQESKDIHHGKCFKGAVEVGIFFKFGRSLLYLSYECKRLNLHMTNNFACDN